MMSALLVFLVAGFAGGILLGLIGVGMALITVPLLIFSLPHFGFAADQVPLVALATSMAVVSVGSVSSVLSHHRKGNVDWRLARTIVPASLTGVAIGSLLAPYLPGTALRVIFAAFLVHVAIRMLHGRRSTDAPDATTPWRYRATGAAIGLAASGIGAGGGVFMVPFLSGRGHPMPRAVATSTLIGLPVSILGAVIYAAHPVNLTAGPALGYLFLPAFVGLAIGSALGAPVGAKFNGVLPERMIKRGFGMLLIIVAVAILAEL